MSDSGLVGVAINVKIAPPVAPPQLVAQIGHSHFVSSVALTHDSKLLVTGSYDYTARLWELSSGKQNPYLSGTFNGVTSVGIAAITNGFQYRK